MFDKCMLLPLKIHDSYALNVYLRFLLRNSMEQANNLFIYRWSPIWRTRTTKQVFLQCGVLWFTQAGKHHVLSPSCAQKETQWLADSTQPRDPTRRVGCLSLSVIFFSQERIFLFVYIHVIFVSLPYHFHKDKKILWKKFYLFFFFIEWHQNYYSTFEILSASN